MENLSVGVQLQAKAEDGKPKPQQGNLACLSMPLAWFGGHFVDLRGA